MNLRGLSPAQQMPIVYWHSMWYHPSSRSEGVEASRTDLVCSFSDTWRFVTHVEDDIGLVAGEISRQDEDE